MITTLLLDVDGVLVFPRPGFGTAIEREYRWHDGYEAFEREVSNDPAVSRTLIGDGDLLTIVQRILPHHVTGLPAKEFIDRWLADAIELNHELLDVIPDIAVEQVYLTTNQDPVRGAYIARLYADRPWLTGTLMSYELGHRKPDPAFFARALRRIHRKPQECLFVDDTAAFVAGAIDIGIPSIQFRDNAQLVAELTAYGLMKRGSGE